MAQWQIDLSACSATVADFLKAIPVLVHMDVIDMHAHLAIMAHQQMQGLESSQNLVAGQLSIAIFKPPVLHGLTVYSSMYTFHSIPLKQCAFQRIEAWDRSNVEQ